MKFLIQKINGEIRHDFAFTLLESIRFKNWLNRNNKNDKIKVKFIDDYEILEPSDIYPPHAFNAFHKNYVPVGSVEFVTDFLEHFYGLTPKPINVPNELFSFAGRTIFNGNKQHFKDWDKCFYKSNDIIKGGSGIFNRKDNLELPEGNYQFSDIVTINSEWRAFVYKGKLVGLHNYCGEFTVFPNVKTIEKMIKAYTSAPVAYTLDVGVTDFDTIVIEVHDFFSCGLYGFANHAIYPHMLYKWFREYLSKNCNIPYNIYV